MSSSSENKTAEISSIIEAAELEELAQYDPYALPPDAIREPPKTLWEALRQTGPGIVLAGTIVGSGELILTTAIGARHGFVFLWLIIFSCVIKVFVQVELGRYAISSGRPTLGALQSISPFRAVGNVLLVWWLLMMLCTVFQLGGMIGGVSQSMLAAMPQFSHASINAVSPLFGVWGEWLSQRPEMLWAFATCLVTIAIVFNGSYRRLEGITTVLVVGLTLITVIATLALNFTNYAPKASDVLEGLMFKIPNSGIAEAFAVFGITGVGATELFYYPYWCLEKGYARYTGLDDGTPEWKERAQGWIRVMMLDAWTSMIVFTVSTIAFYFMGAAVLSPRGMVPQGSQMITTLAEMFKGPFGSWTEVLFLVGAGVVLFKTLYLSCAANSRMTVDFLALMNFVRVPDAKIRAKYISWFCILFPIGALLLYILQRDPQLMVKLGGMAQAATLPMMASATLYFRYFKVDRRLQPGKVTSILLWIAWLSIVAVAAYAIPDQVSKLWPK